MVALGQILVAKGEFDEVERLLEAAGEGGDFSDDVSKLRARLYLARKLEGGSGLEELRAEVAKLDADSSDGIRSEATGL